jgi:hypothetical protein
MYDESLVLFSSPGGRMKLLSIILALLMLFANSGTKAADTKSSSKSSSNKLDLKALGETLKQSVKRGEMTEKEAKEANRLVVFYVQLDTNGDKIIEPEEIQKNRSRSSIEAKVRASGMDPRRPFSLSVFISKRFKLAGIKSVHATRYATKYTTRRKSMQRITVDLPQEYLALDANKDNQIGLYEWPRSKFREFLELDTNNDGFLTPREMLTKERPKD